MLLDIDCRPKSLSSARDRQEENDESKRDEGNPRPRKKSKIEEMWEDEGKAAEERDARLARIDVNMDKLVTILLNKAVAGSAAASRTPSPLTTPSTPSTPESP